VEVSLARSLSYCREMLGIYLEKGKTFGQGRGDLAGAGTALLGCLA
jgi:hypothetical protein